MSLVLGVSVVDFKEKGQLTWLMHARECKLETDTRHYGQLHEKRRKRSEEKIAVQTSHAYPFVNTH